MDKLLAMSILSSTPSEIYGSWMNLSIFSKSDLTNERDAKVVQSKSRIEEAKKERRNEMPESQKEKKLKPRFAVEFDGINCFETIISH
ncbi:hypothetical protein LUZ63_009471 [Rhynchospora breviuscula]|uniref:Uncharacterized protein n=1 Tax=Rhynchospora breviuscula TaxID=2022672 RepID=A0A9Q0HP22_9POAL|nr:hypothetical protein LUZ63_009471 [Rhynchospora breviuscula]